MSVSEPYPILEHMDAYLAIKTTGPSRELDDIIIIGIFLEGNSGSRCVQLVGEDILADSLLKTLDGVDVIYTYNGNRFDVPFIYARLGVNLTMDFDHHDLKYDCWSNGLFGGLKKVERHLGIKRKLKDMNGYEAVRLWRKYIINDDAASLAKLIRYNREDVTNLKILKKTLL